MAAFPAAVAVFHATPVDRTSSLRMVILARGRIGTDFSELPNHIDLTSGRFVGKVPHTVGIGPGINVGLDVRWHEDSEGD
jgi:hypothetical protein